jgi:hypothetical protein
VILPGKNDFAFAEVNNQREALLKIKELLGFVLEKSLGQGLCSEKRWTKARWVLY